MEGEHETLLKIENSDAILQHWHEALLGSSATTFSNIGWRGILQSLGQLHTRAFMTSAIDSVPSHMRELGLWALAHANWHANYYSHDNPYWSELSVLQAAHAGEILIKARIAQEHPLLIFEHLPRPPADHSSLLELRHLTDSGRTYQFSDLPDRLWATTGIRLPGLETYRAFGRLRNAIQHFTVPASAASSSEAIQFIYEVTLDREEGSPFLGRIKRLGVATEGRNAETLSQATVVKAMLKHISSSPAEDQDIMKRGRKPPLPDSDEGSRLIFRRFFLRSEDERIADIMWNYFDAVRTRWPTAWSSTGTGNILNRTNGFNGFMRFLRPAYRHFTTSDGAVSVDQFLSLFATVKIGDEDFNSDVYKPGTSGETAIYYDLIKWTGVQE